MSILALSKKNPSARTEGSKTRLLRVAPSELTRHSVDRHTAAEGRPNARLVGAEAVDGPAATGADGVGGEGVLEVAQITADDRDADCPEGEVDERIAEPSRESFTESRAVHLVGVGAAAPDYGFLRLTPNVRDRDELATDSGFDEGFLVPRHVSARGKGDRRDGDRYIDATHGGRLLEVGGTKLFLI